jgi:hypothetical protein
MRRTRRHCAIKLLTRAILTAIVVCAMGFTACFAQSYSSPLNSLFSLSSLESIVGPIFPAKGLCSTFRSEIGTGFRVGDVVSAKLTGAAQGEVNLRKGAFLDENPICYDAFANLRFWRFGARGIYSNAETRSRQVNGAHIDFSGLILGGDFDSIQFQWLTVGTSVDFYFIDPRLQGVFHTDPLNPGSSLANIDLIGNRPITWGTYLRYVPPEILGFPVHVEARYIVPLSGSKLTIYGVSLAFRPQIYRFDLSCKLIAEKTHLKFQNGADTLNLQIPVATLPPQTWELDMEWKYFGVEFAAYF